jgi:hypothetical protein
MNGAAAPPGRVFEGEKKASPQARFPMKTGDD